jgi:hypothetical protein
MLIVKVVIITAITDEIILTSEHVAIAGTECDTRGTYRFEFYANSSEPSVEIHTDNYEYATLRFPVKHRFGATDEPVIYKPVRTFQLVKNYDTGKCEFIELDNP